MSSDGAHKVVGLDELLERRASALSSGRRVVQCHGCFDIVHPGHIRHLKFAKAQGDVLLVSITGDGQITKGAGRPLIPQELRAENLAELDCVDWVYIDPGATAAELLEHVRPDVYIKGREYEFNDDPRFKEERTTVERHGGRVVFSSGDVVFSSSALIGAMEETIDPFHHRLSRLLSNPALEPGMLEGVVGAMRGKRMVIVGDVIRDTYVFCDRPEVAGESAMMTLRPLERRSYDGGAAVIARHAAALGAKPVLVTAMAPGEVSDGIRSRLNAEGIEIRSIDVDTPIAEKQRFLVGSNKVMKLDLVEHAAIDARERERLVGIAVDASREGADTGVIADFGLGTLTPTMIEALCTGLRPHVGVLSGDVSGRRAGLEQMRGMDLLCPSEAELRDATRNYGDSLPAVVWEMMRAQRTGSTIVTMGADGLIAFDHLSGMSQGEEKWRARLHGEHIPAFTPHAVDALGCGDALLTASTLALSCGASLLASAMLGGLAASVEARTLGNTPVGSAMLRREMTRVTAAYVRLTTPGLGVSGVSREAV